MLSLRDFGGQAGELDEPVTSHANGDESIVTVGDFRIDLRLQRVLVRGHDIRLDEEEFEMLMFLTGHHINIVTPHTRLATRWGCEPVHQSDFLRLLARLRRKLESVAGGARYIRTEPWLVCRFDPGSHADH